MTDDEPTYERAWVHHDGGAMFRPAAKDISVPFFAGWNFRMNEIQGAVLRVQLRRLDGLLKKTRAIKRNMMDALATHPELDFIRYNDPEGDCATQLQFLFRTEEQARAFVAGLQQEGSGAYIVINSSRHVCWDWKPLMQKQGSYHPRLDAFRRPENRGAQMEYSPRMCPRALDILARTVVMGIDPNWSATDVRRRVRACRAAADRLSGAE